MGSDNRIDFSAFRSEPGSPGAQTSRLTPGEQAPRSCPFLVLLCCVFASQSLGADPIGTPAQPARDGTLDLRRGQVRSTSTRLDGRWEFHPDVLLKPGTADAPAGYLAVPGLWNSFQVNGKVFGSRGCATYRLRLLLPESLPDMALRFADAATAYRVFLNGREVWANGNPSCDPALAVPNYRPGVVVPVGLRADNELLVHVSNFVHSKGGLWETIEIGPAALIYAQRERSIWTDVFLTGAFLIMGLYHLGLFLLRRKDRSSLYFGLMCLVVLLRLLVTGERLLFQVAADFPFDLGQKLEYLTAFAATPVFALFMANSFREEVSRIVVSATLVLYAFLGASVLVLPLLLYSRLLPVFFVSSLLLSAYGVVLLGVATKRGRDGALAALLGFTFFSATILNDIVSSSILPGLPLLLPLGLFAFIFSQSFMLSLRFSTAFTNVEHLSDGLQRTAEDLMKTNEAYERFVPTEFLSLLQKDTIKDIRLGDQIQREMTVFFSDIVSFTELSENMSPKENFDFLNSFLKRMQPAIQRNHGFVDKYIGDSIMALFPGRPDDAVRAAVAMQQEIRDYNHHRMGQGYEPVGVRVGIHTGTLMLGTIGSEQRMEGTVISDSVNLASRIEGLNKRLGTSTLISEQTLRGLASPDEFQLRRLGRVQVKGKRQTVSVYEVLTGLNPVLVELLLLSKEAFERGLSALERRAREEAAANFREVLQVHPGDRAARVYLAECEEGEASPES